MSIELNEMNGQTSSQPRNPSQSKSRKGRGPDQQTSEQASQQMYGQTGDVDESLDLEQAQAMAESEGFANLPHPDANVRLRNRSTGEKIRDRLMAARELFSERSVEIFGKARKTATQVSQTANEKLQELPANSREVMGKVDTHVRANPWIHVGAASAGGLLVGYVAGRWLGSRKLQSQAANAASTAG